MPNLADLFRLPDRWSSSQSDGQGGGWPIAHDGGQTFSEFSAQVSSEHEALRNLLRDAERRLDEFAEVKQAFAKIVAPVNNTIRSLEQEIALAFSLSESLNDSRSENQTLQQEARELERQIAALESEKRQLHAQLDQTQQTAGTLHAERVELAGVAAAQALQIDELQQDLARVTDHFEMLEATTRTLEAELRAGDRRIAELSADLTESEEKRAFLEDERRSLLSALEQQVENGSQLEHDLAQTQIELSASETRLTETETALATARDEFVKLRTVFDETQQHHRAELSLFNIKLDASESRADASERLLEEAQDTIASLADEARTYEHKASQATTALHAAEKSESLMRASQEAHERQVRDLEQARDASAERIAALTKSIDERDTTLAQTNGKLEAATERMTRLESQVQTNRSAYEKHIDDLTDELHRIRMDKAVVDEALETARAEQTRLQDGMAAKIIAEPASRARPVKPERKAAARRH